MALVFKDRVKVTSTTTGTGAFTLGSAVTGFQDFSVIGNGNTTYYTITDESGNWEVGIGTYTSSGTSLSRDTILESSSSGSAISFGAGTKTVFVTYPAEKSVYLDASGNLTNNTTGTASNVTGVVAIANGGTGQNSQTAAFDALAPTTTKGDLIVSNGTDNVRLAVGTNNYVLTADSTQASGVKWGTVPSYADIQTFASSGTWTKPTGVTTVMVEVWGAGGGGGGGGRGTATTLGGSGGGGGGFTRKIFSASSLTSTVTVTLGAGGNGGNGRTTNGTGNSGTSGGNSTFGSYITGYGGAGGQSSAVSQGGFGLDYGGSGSATTTDGGGSAVGGGGGGHGSDQTIGTSSAPSAGGSQTAYTGGGGAAGTYGATSTAGTAGGDYQGGGGGGSTTSGIGRSGGAGGLCGGGGGGGSGYNANSGAGGNGGAGYCVVYSW